MRQTVNEYFDVLVITDGTKDRTGIAGFTLSEQAKVDIYKAIFNFIPDPNYYRIGISVVGDELEAYDNARIIMRYKFCAKRLITDLDGWNPSSAPLTQISATYGATNPIVQNIEIQQ